MAMTGLQNASVVYADSGTALDRISLSVEQGEILAVIGPSGSGKSTLLRAVAGLVPLSGGDVFIAGKRVTDLPTDDRRLAMVFESNSVIPFLNVAKNLAFGLQVRKVPPAEADQRVQNQARSLGLSRLLPRLPSTLSSGELGRVGIGRALVHTPSAFLFDEPLAHLDVAESLQVRRQIAETVRRIGAGTMYVTHDHEEAMAIGDRVALLERGALVQVATPGQLYASPVNVFAACFVGSPMIGLLRARPVVAAGGAGGAGGAEGSGGYRVGARTLPLWGPLPEPVRRYLGRDVVLGIRPEDVHDARDGNDPSTVSMPASIVRLETTGRDSVLTLELAAEPVGVPGSEAWLAGTPGSGRTLVRARFEPANPVRLGESVLVALDVARAHVFDHETGRALWHPPA